MTLLDRLGRVVRSEIGHLRRPKPTTKSPTVGPIVDAAMPMRAPAVVDVEGALRVLELTGKPSLDAVRAQYRALAHRYHPKTRSAVTEEARAARVVLEALTDSLELLEEHLLPA